MSDVSDFKLSPEQVAAILAESLHRGYWELDGDGNLPRDPRDQLIAAQDLLRQCRLSYLAGNRLEGVTALLHIAEDDLVSAESNRDTGGSMATEVDLSAHPLETLKKFETTLLGHPQETEEQAREVQENLALVRAEIARKGGVPPAPTPTPEPVQPAPVEAAPAAPQVDRAGLENQLTFKIMRAHSIDPSDVPSITDDQLQWILSHPDGAGEVQSQPAQSRPLLPPVPEPQGDTIETTKMVINRDPEPTPVPNVPAPAEASKSDRDPEREELEGQVTGPILKAYGRGRTDVPGIGINELRFMIHNPAGRVTAEQLAAAKALDMGNAEEDTQAVPPDSVVAETEVEDPPSPAPSRAPSDPAPVVESSAPVVSSGGPSFQVTSVPSDAPSGEPEMVVTKEVLGPEQVDHFLPQVDEQIETARENGVQERAQQRQDQEAPLYQQLANGESQTVAATVAIDVPREDVAAQIIEREHFPIPEDIEQPPRMPADMSKLSQEELYSLHARFHAVESRANVVISQEEDRVADLEKLVRGREVEVLNSLPTKDPEDGRKRLTESQRDALVAADPAVQSIKVNLHQATKIVRKLKVLRDNYHRDVERSSRQMTRFTQEREGAR